MVSGRSTFGNVRYCVKELKAELAETKAEIIKWMSGAIGFQTLIILGAVIALARLLQP